MDVTLCLERTATKYVKNVCANMFSKSNENPANIYLFKVDNKNRKKYEMSSKLTIKTPEQRH